MLQDNLWKIITKDFSADNFDIVKDVKIMSDEYPFEAVMKVGGAKETSEDVNITAAGKLTIEGTTGMKTLIASAPSYIKDCKFT